MGRMTGQLAWVEPRRRADDLIQHICTRIGVSSNAAAARFAMEHHLLANKSMGSSTHAGPGAAAGSWQHWTKEWLP
jgi:hypothetical protein